MEQVNPHYLDHLNEQQRQAVLYCDGPQLVIAGAGSGKTRVLTYKIAHLLHGGYAPYRIMALTFTNKAAREMRQRIGQLVAEDVASQLWMGTFHSVFARLLRINAERIEFRHDFTIYDQSDSRSLIKLIVDEMKLDNKVYRPAMLQIRISNMKNALLGPDDYARDSDLRAEDIALGCPRTWEIYRTYWDRCRIANAMDFDDLLFYTNNLLRDCPDLLAKYQQMFQYVLVDEYQDTNFAQHMIVMQLTQQHRRLCVVGDDAQSIYSFRGANISNILQLERFYPDLVTHKLERNYRSTQNILEAANSLIAKNTQQIAKHIYSLGDKGCRIPVIHCYSDYEEAYVVANQIQAIKARQGDSYNDFAVLYRTNAQSRVLEEAFSNGGRRDKHGHVRNAIPYRVYGGLSFYQRKEIKDAIAYFRMAINPNDDEALRRIINYPSRGIGDTTVGKVQHCAIEDGTSMWHVITHPTETQLNVHSGTLKKLNAFAEMINTFRRMVSEQTDALTVAKAIIDRSQLLSILLGDKTPENISRRENLAELLAGIHAFVDEKLESGDSDNQLSHYLAEVSLLTDQDRDDSDDNRVTLMTIHAAKGLEFKNIFVVGVEEDLLPSAMNRDSIAAIEEERRLLYVAITRAMTTCVITYCTSRYRNGENKSCQMSRFLRDIDAELLQMTSTADESRETVETMRRRWNGQWATDDSGTTGNRAERHTLPPRLAPSGGARPAAAPRRQPMSTPHGQFSTHTLDEVMVGTKISHPLFGHGTVMLVDANAVDPKITVDFGNVGSKNMVLKYAKFEIL